MSLFDPIKPYLCPDIFTKQNKLRPYVRLVITTGVELLVPKEHVGGIYIRGSVIDYKCSYTSDVDVNILLKPEHADRRAEFHSMVKGSNGKTFIKKHPINYFIDIMPDEWNMLHLRRLYDVTNNKWVATPDRTKAITRKKALELASPVAPIAATNAELQIEQLAKAIRSGDMDRILHEAKDVTQFYKILDRKRKRGYALGAGTYSHQNALYKYVEHEGKYPDTLGKIYELLRDRV